MGDSGGERTEKATPKKRKDAREKGQVRKSQEVNTALMLIILFAALMLVAPGMWDGMLSLLRDTLTGDLYTYDITTSNLGGLFLEVIRRFAVIVLPILAIALIGGVAANLLQVGFLFSTKALAPKMDRINPLKGFKRIFSMRTLYELAKSIIKVVIIGIIAYNQYISNKDKMPLLLGSNVAVSFAAGMDIVAQAALTIGIAMLIFSALDYFYQWWKYEKDLKMTKYEVKMEYKQNEGDPQIKSKIKQKQRQMAMMRMMQSVPEADVVITNPTHFAVALKYDEGVARAPVVVAKGADHVAMRIKEIARESNVEIVENKPVARGLFELCEIGAEVPVELYQAVAEILAYVYKLKNKTDF